MVAFMVRAAIIACQEPARNPGRPQSPPMRIYPLASSVFLLSLAGTAFPARSQGPALESALATWQSRHGARWRVAADERTGFAELVYGGGLASATRPVAD